MNLHSATFTVRGNGRDVPSRAVLLPGAVAEWLVHVKLWDRFNSAHGTLFMHCEDDVLPPALIDALMKELQVLHDEVSRSPATETLFIMGWLAKTGMELVCVVEHERLIRDLSQLLRLLERAQASQSEVLCSL